MTEEQVKAAKARFFLQKRETFAQGILYNLCGNEASLSTVVAEPEVLAKAAVKLADALMKELYVNDLPSYEAEAEK